MNKLLTITIALASLNCESLNHDFKESKRETEKSSSGASMPNIGASATPVSLTTDTIEEGEIQEDQGVQEVPESLNSIATSNSGDELMKRIQILKM